jgi:hypothetical protein
VVMTRDGISAKRPGQDFLEVDNQFRLATMSYETANSSNLLPSPSI